MPQRASQRVGMERASTMPYRREIDLRCAPMSQAPRSANQAQIKAQDKFAMMSVHQRDVPRGGANQGARQLSKRQQGSSAATPEGHGEDAIYRVELSGNRYQIACRRTPPVKGLEPLGIYQTREVFANESGALALRSPEVYHHFWVDTCHHLGNTALVSEESDAQSSHDFRAIMVDRRPGCRFGKCRGLRLKQDLSSPRKSCLQRRQSDD